jgi:hypothetical protein
MDFAPVWGYAGEMSQHHAKLVHNIVGKANGEDFLLKFDPPVGIWQALKRCSEEEKRRARAARS